MSKLAVTSMNFPFSFSSPPSFVPPPSPPPGADRIRIPRPLYNIRWSSRNRLAALINRAWEYFFHERAQRLILPWPAVHLVCKAFVVRAAFAGGSASKCKPPEDEGIDGCRTSRFIRKCGRRPVPSGRPSSRTPS
jgi:hypothetical protein